VQRFLASIRLVASLALQPMPLDGAHMEEVLAVLAERVLGRHVDGLQVVGEGRLVRAHPSTEVTPPQLTN